MAFPTGSTAKKLTIDNTKVSGSSNLTDFPVLVKDGNIDSAVYAGMNNTLITQSLLTNGTNSSGTSYNTASISPSANKLILVMVHSRDNSSPHSVPTLSGLSITWTQVVTKTQTGGGGTVGNTVTVFRGVTSDSPGSGALTIDFATSQARIGWIVSEFSNTDIGNAGANAIVQTATSGSETGSGSVGPNLSAFSSLNNATFAAFIMNGTNPSWTPEAGYTEIVDQTSYSYNRGMTMWRNDNDTTPRATMVMDESTQEYASVAIELRSNIGSDLRFTTDSAGTTEVPFEIVSLNPSAETCEIWVKVPTVSYNTDTVFYMWYGDSTLTPYAPSDTYGSQNVWRSEYKAVYHLQETSGQRNDSTVNANNLTDNNTVASGTGQIGTGADFERSNSEYLSKTDNASISTTGDFTISGWLKLEQLASSAGGSMSLLSKYDFTNTDREYLLAIRNTTDKFSVFYSSTGSAFTEIQSATTLVSGNVGNFLYVTAIVDVSAQTCTYVINGVSESGTAVATNATSVKDGASPLVLGANDEGRADYLDAVLDEMRLYFGLQTSDWAITEYNNQNSPSTFLTMSDVTNIKSVNGVSYANIKNINGLAISSIKSVNGVA